MGSFKVKLVGYFLLLSLLPLAAACWGFSTVAGRSESPRVGARLQAGLRAALATYEDELVGADAAAAQLARSPAFQRALVRRDRTTIQRLLRGHATLSVEAGDGFRVGTLDPTAATREVAVVGNGGTHGAVIAAVPLDRTLAERLEGRSGLDADEHVILIEDRRVVAGPADSPGGRFEAVAGQTHTLRFGGTRYRALVAETLNGVPSATIGVISPQTRIDAAKHAAMQRLARGALCLSPARRGGRVHRGPRDRPHAAQARRRDARDLARRSRAARARAGARRVPPPGPERQPHSRPAPE